MRCKKKRNHKSLGITVAIIVVLILLGFGVVWFVRGNNSSLDDKLPIKGILTPSQEETDGNRELNDLTGLPMDKQYKNDRPIGVMINNLDGAQPLLGVSEADIMYECPVEGGITRILAIFKNPRGIEKIGSVRSARPYFIYIAQGLDAIYMHIGGSTQATEMLKSKDIDSFSLGAYGNMMWRDPERRANLGYEHSALTSGQRLIEGIKDSGIRTELKSGYDFKQSFSEKDSQVNNGIQAQKVEAIFSHYKSTVFSYNTEKETYMISQFNEPQMDDNAKVQNSKKNIILLKADVTTINKNNDLKSIAIIGSGNGKYISNGRVIDIKWSKASATEPIKYTTLDNKDLVMIPGQSYVCVLPLEANVKIS